MFFLTLGSYVSCLLFIISLRFPTEKSIAVNIGSVFRLTSTLAAVMASHQLRLNFSVVNYFCFIYHEELIHISEAIYKNNTYTSPPTTVKEITSKYS